MRAGLVSVALLLASSSGFGAGVLAPALPTPPLSTPPGITFADVVGVDGRFLWRYLATDVGKPLYSFDADGNKGKATCVKECSEQFIPYLAAEDAKASAEWTLIVRGPRQRQWAYRGRPLYTFSGQDPVPYDQFALDSFVNDKAAIFDPKYLDAGSDFFSPKHGWRRAAYTPEESTPAPSGIALRSSPVANGYLLVDSATGMPLYVMSTLPKHPSAWNPMYAPDMAGPVGEFSTVVRPDGRKQWAYRGVLLWSYRDDYVPDHLNGMLEQQDAEPALAYQFFLPPAVRIQPEQFRGPLMVTANGMSLYAESRAGGGGTGGRGVQTHACVDDCLNSWHPLLASARDQASGFWQIYQRPDGLRQWAYDGGALFTYVGDRAPGDVEGNNIRVVIYGDRYGKNIDEVELAGGLRGPNVRIYAGAGFIWRLVRLSSSDAGYF